MENAKEKNPLGYEKISKLLVKFAIPSVVAMLVSSFYNLVIKCVLYAIFNGNNDCLIHLIADNLANSGFSVITLCQLQYLLWTLI